jgi:hypothetical protein
MEMIIQISVIGAAAAPGAYYMGKAMGNMLCGLGVWLVLMGSVAAHLRRALEIYGG